MQLATGHGLAQTHPVKQAFQALDQANVIGVGIPTNKVLFDPFEGKKQAGEVFNRLAMKVLQMLKDIASGRIPVDALAISIEAGDGKRADFELLHDRRI